MDIGQVRESIGKASGNAERAGSLEQPITARDSVCLAREESLKAGWKEIQIPSRKQNILVLRCSLDFDLKIWLRFRKVTGSFEEGVPNGHCCRFGVSPLLREHACPVLARNSPAIKKKTTVL